LLDAGLDSVGSIPRCWLQSLELRQVIEETAAQLHRRFGA
jgi:hypothetical protein